MILIVASLCFILRLCMWGQFKNYIQRQKDKTLKLLSAYLIFLSKYILIPSLRYLCIYLRKHLFEKMMKETTLLPLCRGHFSQTVTSCFTRHQQQSSNTDICLKITLKYWYFCFSGKYIEKAVLSTVVFISYEHAFTSDFFKPIKLFDRNKLVILFNYNCCKKLLTILNTKRNFTMTNICYQKNNCLVFTINTVVPFELFYTK